MSLGVRLGGIGGWYLLNGDNWVLITHCLGPWIPRSGLLVMEEWLKALWKSVTAGCDGHAEPHLSCMIQHMRSREVIIDYLVLHAGGCRR